ncbi:MAG: hypothetical protein ABI639_02500 [Thermoanaerobaculia bacterium]
MPQVVRAYPVLPGFEAKTMAIAREMKGARAREAREFFRHHGIARESWHAQTTPNGMWIIAVTDIPDKPVVQAARDYAASVLPFDRWLKDQVKIVTGIDPDKDPLGPPTDCIFDSVIDTDETAGD